MGHNWNPHDDLFDTGRMYFSTSSGSPKKVIRAERRRRAEPPESGRERADAPQRERPSSSTPSFGGGSGGGSPSSYPSSGSGVPLRGPQAIIAFVFIVIVLCVFGGMQLFGGGGDNGEEVYQQPAFVTEAAEPTEPFAILPLESPTPWSDLTIRPTSDSSAASAATKGQTWLVMLYQDADDKILEQDIYVDLNEAERIGSSERLTIVAQVDRYRAGFQGDGDWTSAKRFLVTQDDDLGRVRSQQIADLGEANMADSAELVDFVEWAVENYPADRTVLILSDHGMGWPGGWSDADSAGRSNSSAPLAANLGDQIYLNELDAALGEIRARTGLEQLDLIGLDACLMGQLEVFSALAPHARVAVASEEVEPALGWAYTGFLSELSQNPDLSAADLGRLIVETYIDGDQRIVDNQARQEMLRQGGGMGGMFGLFGEVSSSSLARQMGQDSTLTAVDLAAIPALVDEVNQFAYVLQGASQAQVARARSYAQSFTSIFGSKVPPSYIDLGNFARLLINESGDQAVVQAGERVLSALGQAVIAEKHGPKKPGASGIAIYFPNSQLYKTMEGGPRSYTVLADRFVEQSLWDDFLAFHYTGRLFEPREGSVAVPPADIPVRAPGAGTIQLSPVILSDPVAAPGKPVILSTDISGENVGIVNLFVGFFDRSANSIFIADMDYLESADTREVDGVYYPDWGTDDFTLEFEWEPVVFAIDDGQQRVVALFEPQSYGASYEDTVYIVDGIYTFADGGETRRARLYFSDGALRQVVGFTGDEETGAPREIIPQTGDQFTVLERWLDLDSSGKVSQTSKQPGDTLTFGNQTFRWVELDAAVGEYIVGFIVEDLDGNAYQVFTQVAVE